MADIFDVISDTTRRDLLQVLLDRYIAPGSAAGEISVGDLVTALGLSQPTVSKHLRVLRDIGLVNVRDEGQHRYYSLNSAPLEIVEDWLIPFLSADFDAEADAESSAVFSAWSGAHLPAPLRRATESLQNPGDAGAAVGRAVADATHQARSRIEDASHEVERRVIEPIKKKLKKD
jgi:ArsR family transcriptional regulator, arsenate/arsenite/antimonite-responsive transcriptional repressor